jgi:IS1 family transposase
VSLLTLEKRAEVVSHLVEGASIRSTARLCDVDKETVMTLLVKVGAGCARLHNRLVRDLTITRIECDEIWSYVHTKDARVKPTDPAEYGDIWTYVAMGSTSKLIIAYAVGKRDDATTHAFIGDVRARLLTIPMLSTDGFQAYPQAIEDHFGIAVDYGQVIKSFNGRDYDRYAPPAQAFVVKRAVAGAPDMAKCSTSLVERQNLTIRMAIRRFMRRGNAFSKKASNHAAAVALHFAYYNFCRIHEAIRSTPAMEARVTSTVWTVAQLVELALAEPETALPEPRPLAPRQGTQGAARELPGGRGWLRVIDGGKNAAPPVKEAPRKAEQLTLFDDE